MSFAQVLSEHAIVYPMAQNLMSGQAANPVSCAMTDMPVEVYCLAGHMWSIQAATTEAQVVFT